MKQTSRFRTALLSLVAVFAFGFGFTSCTDDDPADLIIGTWNLSTQETYINNLLNTKVDFDKHIIDYYEAGEWAESEAIDAAITFTFDNDKNCSFTAYEEDEAECGTATYSIETVNSEKRLLITDDGETIYMVIDKLTKKELVLSQTGSDDEGTYKSIMHFKK